VQCPFEAPIGIVLECSVRHIPGRRAPFDTSEDCVPVIRKDSTLNFERYHEPLDNVLSDPGCFYSAEGGA
jgi:hypothetical protein